MGRVNEQGWKKAAVDWGDDDRRVADLVDCKAWRPAWQEVVVFLDGQLDRPRPLVELLADVKPGRVPDDDFRHRLALAAPALAEVAGRAGLDDLMAAHFGAWWRRERDGTRAAVPHLTAALPALAVLNGRLPAEGGSPGPVRLLGRLAGLLGDPDEGVRLAATGVVDALQTKDGPTPGTRLRFWGMVRSGKGKSRGKIIARPVRELGARELLALRDRTS